MAKYKLRPVIIEAEPFKEGMEDGYNFYPVFSNQFIQSMTKEEMKTKPYPKTNRVPFIETFNGRKEVHQGDYIITDETGERSVCRGAVFKQQYSPVFDIDYIENASLPF